MQTNPRKVTLKHRNYKNWFLKGFTSLDDDLLLGDRGQWRSAPCERSSSSSKFFLIPSKTVSLISSYIWHPPFLHKAPTKSPEFRKTFTCINVILQVLGHNTGSRKLWVKFGILGNFQGFKLLFFVPTATESSSLKWQLNLMAGI